MREWLTLQTQEVQLQSTGLGHPIALATGSGWPTAHLCLKQCLSWDMTPPPQDREQVDQELHSPHHLVTSSSQAPAPSAASLLS